MYRREKLKNRLEFDIQIKFERENWEKKKEVSEREMIISW